MKKVFFGLAFLLVFGTMHAQTGGNTQITRAYLNSLPTYEEGIMTILDFFPEAVLDLSTPNQQEGMRIQVAQYAVIIGDCCYTITLWEHSFLGITWGSYYYGPPVLVGCV